MSTLHHCALLLLLFEETLCYQSLHPIAHTSLQPRSQLILQVCKFCQLLTHFGSWQREVGEAGTTVNLGMVATLNSSKGGFLVVSWGPDSISVKWLQVPWGSLPSWPAVARSLLAPVPIATLFALGVHITVLHTAHHCIELHKKCCITLLQLHYNVTLGRIGLPHQSDLSIMAQFYKGSTRYNCQMTMHFSSSARWSVPHPTQSL